MWNPETMRLALCDEFIARTLAQPYIESYPMGSFAADYVSIAAELCLVGKSGKPVVELCERAVDWIDRAIARGEQMAGETDFYHQSLLQKKAMALWLSKTQAAEPVWSEAFDRKLSRLHKLGNQLRGWHRSVSLDNLMACALQGRRCADGVTAYEALSGKTAQRLTPAKVASPRQLAYVMCRQDVNPFWKQSDLLQAGKRVLQKNLAEYWLHNGQYVNAAMWLKIVYWTPNSALQPADILLNAYADMPSISPPDFLTRR